MFYSSKGSLFVRPKKLQCFMFLNGRQQLYVFKSSIPCLNIMQMKTKLCLPTSHVRYLVGLQTLVSGSLDQHWKEKELITLANFPFAETAPQILKGLDNISGFEEQEVTMEVEVDKDHWKKNGSPIEGQWLRGEILLVAH